MRLRRPLRLTVVLGDSWFARYGLDMPRPRSLGLRVTQGHSCFAGRGPALLLGLTAALGGASEAARRAAMALPRRLRLLVGDVDSGFGGRGPARWPPRWLWLALLLPALACGGAGGGGDAGAGGGGAGCAPAKTPPNLLANGSFECSATGPEGFFARDGELTLVAGEGRAGSRSARLTIPQAGPTDVTLAATGNVATNLGANTYCATAWVKGTVSDARLVLRRSSGGAVEDFTFSGPVTSTWQRLPPSLVVKASGANAPALLLLVQSRNGKPGEALFVDDVDVWVSGSGACDEVR